jgi:hypothetical protein
MFGHLPLADCSVCKRVCAGTVLTGVDCTGIIRMPAHKCEDCGGGIAYNRACVNYYTYGYDCHGRHPGMTD